MKRFHFNIVLEDSEINTTADSNSKATAFTMAINRLSEAEQKEIVAINIHEEEELKI